MRLKSFLFVCLLLAGVLSSRAEALIVVSEILADPPAGLAGDSNNDGVRSTTNDEFIEVFNNGNQAVDLSGWTIRDLTDIRHVFPNNTILNPFNYLVVFGGGAPAIPDIDWQKSSTGSLSLNNTDETISLFHSDGALINQVSYGSLANNDQSIVRAPEGSGSFVLHSSVSSRLFSPGEPSNPAVQSTVVPEPSGFLSLLAGGYLLRNYRRRNA
ncbi:MAG: lamin tail domain-containing protein [Candidatus Omnitrophota bacterium]